MRRLNPFLLLCLPVLFLLPSLGGFLYSAGSDATDMAVSHYPNALFIQRAIREANQIPLWSGAILSGLPLTANPLSGLHYPPGWLSLLFPLPFGLNLLAVVHILFGGYGMLRFLNAYGLGRPASLFGALAFAGLPRLFSHLGAGHLTLIYAYSWTPWLLLAQLSAERAPKRAWALPGLVLGIILLADPRYAAIAGLLWVGYVLAFSLRREPFREAAARLVRVLGGAAFAVGVGAALLLPLAEFVGLSTRGQMTSNDVATLSLPPARLLGFFVPEMGGTAEWVVYPGAIVLGLALLAVSLPAERKRAIAWWALFGAFTLLSLGSYLPGYTLLAHLPGFDLLRVPPRMMLAASFALVAAAACGVNASLSSARFPRINLLLLLPGLGVLDLAFAVMFWLTAHAFPARFLWGGVALLGAFVLIRLRAAETLKPGRALILMLAWLLLDQTGVNALSLQSRPPAQVLAEGGEAAASLVNTLPFDHFRVYSPSYSLPQQTAAYYRLELADGVDPLQLSAYRDFMERATGVPNPSYSVTLPPFADGAIRSANREYIPDAALLGCLNVRYVLAAFPLAADGLQLAGQVGETYIYRNEYERPRAWLQDSAASAGAAESTGVPVLRTPNTLNLAAAGPGLLVVSEVNYPGWKVFVDGKPARLEAVDGLLRGVTLKEGNHEVLFRFQPTAFFVGIVISLTCVAGLAISLRFSRRTGRG